MQELNKSRFSLDLNGVGEPNKRTFEILSQGSLMISEYDNLKWPFEETFSEETIFKDENEFINKINKLNSDGELYKNCLDNQINIYNRYFNKTWIKSYILSFINF